MEKYDCYYDASFRDKTGRLAYYITHNGVMRYCMVCQITVNTVSDAEAQSLHRLLIYIQSHIENGSTVHVYGDSKTIIGYLLNKNKGKYPKLKGLYDELRALYDLKIKYIPRSKNTVADKLSKSKPKEKVFIYSRHIPLDSIVIPAYWQCNTERPKYRNQLAYYAQHNRIKKPIKVKENNCLFDGYISYLILIGNGVTAHDVDVYKLIKSKSV